MSYQNKGKSPIISIFLNEAEMSGNKLEIELFNDTLHKLRQSAEL